MAKCRITNIKPPCDYQVEGIAKIWLLDWEDFKGYRFMGGGSYQSCLVTDILRLADFTELSAPDMVAKYSSSGNYIHNLETFASGLGASTIANLHLGTKRRQLVMFLSNSGKYFTFGYEAGAVLTYQNQTAEGFGSIVSITANSVYPLFEVKGDIFKPILGEFVPDFGYRTFCQFNEIEFLPNLENQTYCETYD